ncbi:CidA/LrgA family protein [Paenibacillus sp. FSL R5-0713]|uniref:CidA/LrgA family protein n=1 Tax=Paenibacillus sp. FSL R5-0713 TaxID=2921655 RepID=UPI0030D95644
MGIPLKKYTGIVLQVLLMYGFYWIGNLIQTLLHLPLTGSIVGMLVLFIAIQLGWVKMSWGEEGSTWLQSHLQLLFIPPTVGIINHFDFFRANTLLLVLGLIVSTLITCLISAKLSEWLMIWRSSHKGKKEAITCQHSSSELE